MNRKIILVFILSLSINFVFYSDVVFATSHAGGTGGASGGGTGGSGVPQNKDGGAGGKGGDGGANSNGGKGGDGGAGGKTNNSNLTTSAEWTAQGGGAGGAGGKGGDGNGGSGGVGGKGGDGGEGGNVKFGDRTSNLPATGAGGNGGNGGDGGNGGNNGKTTGNIFEDPTNGGAGGNGNAGGNGTTGGVGGELNYGENNTFQNIYKVIGAGGGGGGAGGKGGQGGAGGRGGEGTGANARDGRDGGAGGRGGDGGVSRDGGAGGNINNLKLNNGTAGTLEMDAGAGGNGGAGADGGAGGKGGDGGDCNGDQSGGDGADGGRGGSGSDGGSGGAGGSFNGNLGIGGIIGPANPAGTSYIKAGKGGDGANGGAGGAGGEGGYGGNGYGTAPTGRKEGDGGNGGRGGNGGNGGAGGTGGGITGNISIDNATINSILNIASGDGGAGGNGGNGGKGGAGGKAHEHSGDTAYGDDGVAGSAGTSGRGGAGGSAGNITGTIDINRTTINNTINVLGGTGGNGGNGGSGRNGGVGGAGGNIGNTSGGNNYLLSVENNSFSQGTSSINIKGGNGGNGGNSANGGAGGSIGGNSNSLSTINIKNNRNTSSNGILGILLEGGKGGNSGNGSSNVRGGTGGSVNYNNINIENNELTTIKLILTAGKGGAGGSTQRNGSIINNNIAISNNTSNAGEITGETRNSNDFGSANFYTSVFVKLDGSNTTTTTGQSNSVSNNSIDINNNLLNFNTDGNIGKDIIGVYVKFVNNSAAAMTGNAVKLDNNRVLITKGNAKDVFGALLDINESYLDTSNSSLTGNSVLVSDQNGATNIAGTVYGAATNTGINVGASGAGNSVEVNMINGSSKISGGVVGGYTSGNGDLTDNNVLVSNLAGSITSSSTGKIPGVALSGATTTGTGTTTNNGVLIDLITGFPSSSSSISGNVYGAYVNSINGGDSSKNYVNVKSLIGSITGDLVGAKYIGGSSKVSENSVEIGSLVGTITGNLIGAQYDSGSGEVSGNKVTINSLIGKITGNIYGAENKGTGDSKSNSVIIEATIDNINSTAGITSIIGSNATTNAQNTSINNSNSVSIADYDTSDSGSTISRTTILTGVSNIYGAQTQNLGTATSGNSVAIKLKDTNSKVGADKIYGAIINGMTNASSSRTANSNSLIIDGGNITGKSIGALVVKSMTGNFNIGTGSNNGNKVSLSSNNSNLTITIDNISESGWNSGIFGVNATSDLNTSGLTIDNTGVEIKDNVNNSVIINVNDNGAIYGVYANITNNTIMSDYKIQNTNVDITLNNSNSLINSRIIGISTNLPSVIDKNTLKIEGGRITGTEIIGVRSENQSSEVTNNEVTISKADITNQIYGVWTQDGGSVSGENKLNVSSSTIRGNLYGVYDNKSNTDISGFETNLSGGTYLNDIKSIFIKDVNNGGHTNNISTNTLNIKAGNGNFIFDTVGKRIYNVAVENKTNEKVISSNITNLEDGDYSMILGRNVNNSSNRFDLYNVYVKGGSVTGATGNITGNKLNINLNNANSIINGNIYNIYMGTSNYTIGDSNNELNISAGRIVGDVTSIYTEGIGAVNYSTLNLNASTGLVNITGNVYGVNVKKNGTTASPNVSNSNININMGNRNSKITGNVYAVNSDKGDGNIENSKVTIDNGTIVGDVFVINKETKTSGNVNNNELVLNGGNILGNNVARGNVYGAYINSISTSGEIKDNIFTVDTESNLNINGSVYGTYLTGTSADSVNTGDSANGKKSVLKDNEIGNISIGGDLINIYSETTSGSIKNSRLYLDIHTDNTKIGGDIYGVKSKNASVEGNIIEIAEGSTIDNRLYTAYSDNDGTTLKDNQLIINKNAVVNKDIYVARNGNGVNITGSRLFIGQGVKFSGSVFANGTGGHTIVNTDLGHMEGSGNVLNGGGNIYFVGKNISLLSNNVVDDYSSINFTSIASADGIGGGFATGLVTDGSTNIIIDKVINYKNNDIKFDSNITLDLDLNLVDLKPTDALVKTAGKISGFDDIDGNASNILLNLNTLGENDKYILFETTNSENISKITEGSFVLGDNSYIKSVEIENNKQIVINTYRNFTGVIKYVDVVNDLLYLKNFTDAMTQALGYMNKSENKELYANNEQFKLLDKLIFIFNDTDDGIKEEYVPFIHGIIKGWLPELSGAKFQLARDNFYHLSSRINNRLNSLLDYSIFDKRNYINEYREASYNYLIAKNMEENQEVFDYDYSPLKSKRAVIKNWLEVFDGSTKKVENKVENDHFDPFESENTGFVIGKETIYSKKEVFGATFSYNLNKMRNDYKHLDMNSFGLSAYTRYNFNDIFYASGIFSYMYGVFKEKNAGELSYKEFKNHNNKTISIENLKFESKYNTNQFSSDVSIGLDSRFIVPQIGLNYNYLMTDSYTDNYENSIDKNSYQSLSAFGGLTLKNFANIRMGPIHIKPQIFGKFKYGLINPEMKFSGRLNGDSRYEINLGEMEEQLLQFGGNIDIEIANKFNISFSYDTIKNIGYNNDSTLERKIYSNYKSEEFGVKLNFLW